MDERYKLMRRHSRTHLALLFAVGAAAAAFAPVAGAATVSKYHPQRNSRTFAHSAGGWRSHEAYGPGLCIPGVNCPTVTDSYASHGGVGRGHDGYLSTRLSSLTGVAAQSRGVWRSPAFRYRGAKGKRPRLLSLSLTRRSRVAALLDVVGNSANYTVEIVRAGNGVAVTPVDHRKVKQTKSWTRTNVRLRPGALKIGRRYFVRVTTEFKTGVDVFPDATADYDNVFVRASRGGGGGRHTAVLHGNRLRIRVGCSRKYRPGRCKIKTSGLVHRRGPRVTRAGFAKVRAGHRKTVTMRVRHRYGHWVNKHKAILVRERLRVHHRTHRFYRRYRIVRR
jgi:hypothetical protein